MVLNPHVRDQAMLGSMHQLVSKTSTSVPWKRYNRQIHAGIDRRYCSFMCTTICVSSPAAMI